MASSSVTAGIAIACALACGNAWAIYKCTDAQGKTTYQQTPCESNAAQTSIGPEKRPAPQKTAAAAPGARPPPPPIATLMSSVVRCSELSPAFADRIQPTYTRWVDANPGGVQSFQRSPEYTKLMADARKERAASGGRMSPELVEECKKTEEYFAQNYAAPAK
jgi:hypothetical protein